MELTSNTGRRALLMCKACACPTRHVFVRNEPVTHPDDGSLIQTRHVYICTASRIDGGDPVFCRTTRVWGAEGPQ